MQDEKRKISIIATNTIIILLFSLAFFALLFSSHTGKIKPKKFNEKAALKNSSNQSFHPIRDLLNLNSIKEEFQLFQENFFYKRNVSSFCYKFLL